MVKKSREAALPPATTTGVEARVKFYFKKRLFLVEIILHGQGAGTRSL